MTTATAERTAPRIDSDLARRAHEYMSMRDYDGRAERDFAEMCGKARALADDAIARAPHRADEIEALYSRYCEKAAWYINEENRIGCMCPSFMVAGPANFPIKRKERQVAAWGRLHEQWCMFEQMERKLRTIGTAREPINSADADALERLRDKLAAREADQERMKAVNAHYRKHGTVHGCPGVSDAEADAIEREMQQPYHWGDAPFLPFELSNNNAEIRRLRGRVAELEAARAAEPAAERTATICGECCRVVEDSDDMRLRLFFDGKPSDECRAAIKGEGFRWAPSVEAWQRQLTDNARRALARLESR